MRIPVPCIVCLTTDRVLGRIPYAFGIVDDEGRVTGTCEHGHTVVHHTPRPNHEWLTTAGACALVDGYYREAVASFAAALESAYVFYVEVSLHKAGIPRPAVRELCRKNRLEQRRLGMIAACYLRDTGNQFPFAREEQTKFRNDVVHNRHWPSRDQAVGYAEHVCWSIAELYQVLGPSLEEFYLLRIGETLPPQNTDESRVQHFGSDDIEQFLTFFMQAQTFDEALAEFNRYGPKRAMGVVQIVK